jgi:hypothetical protein
MHVAVALCARIHADGQHRGRAAPQGGKEGRTLPRGARGRSGAARTMSISKAYLNRVLACATMNDEAALWHAMDRMATIIEARLEAGTLDGMWGDARRKVYSMIKKIPDKWECEGVSLIGMEINIEGTTFKNGKSIGAKKMLHSKCEDAKRTLTAEIGDIKNTKLTIRENAKISVTVGGKTLTNADDFATKKDLNALLDYMMSKADAETDSIIKAFNGLKQPEQDEIRRTNQ